jgi:bifunctional UDP-N-acetylglucosamine pyrophosphorylase/glucosamine-1-phosphate N-acetyltransferase
VDSTAGLGETLSSLCESGGWTLVVHGDIFITRQDLATMLELPFGNAAAAALLQSNNGEFRSGDWICAKAVEDKVEAFWGHPRGNYANARSCGVFLLGPKALPYLSAALPHFENVPSGGMPPPGFWLENCLQTALNDGLPVKARYVKSSFVDMDFPWDYLEANQLCCQAESGTSAVGKPVLGDNCMIGDNVLFKGCSIVGSGTVIRNNVVIGENCIIGNNCVIEDYCKIAANTVIGNNCKLGFTAEVGGVFMDRAAAVHHCELYGIVGIFFLMIRRPPRSTLRFDDADTSQLVQGKRYTHPLSRMNFIGDYSRTGVNTSFLPGIKMGANCAIGPGVVLGKDLPHNTLLSLKQNLIETAWGPQKYGWADQGR